MGQGGTWRRGSLCPGWLQESVGAVCLSFNLRSSTHRGSLAMRRSWTGPQRGSPALHGSYCSLRCWASCETHSGLVTCRRKE